MNRSPSFALTLSLALLGGISVASAAFVKIEDFQAHALNSAVTTANGWVSNGTTTGISVVADPVSSANKVLAISNNTNANVYLNSTAKAAVAIPNGTTATLFLRFRVNGPKNYSFGMSDIAAPVAAAFTDYESQFNENNSLNEAHIRDGAAFKNLSPATPLAANQWYNLWMVINNTTDTTTVYLDTTTPPGGTTSALQNNAGVTVFSFRNGTAANALNSFVIKTSGGTDEPQSGTVYLDDIWINAGGQNLTNPTVPPANLVVAVNDTAEVGIGGSLGVDPTPNDTTTVGTLDPSTLQVITPPTNGTAVFDPVAKKILYHHTGAAAGTDSFRYSVSNTAGATPAQANVNVTISGALRLANATLTLPADPPPGGALQLSDAFPGLTIDGMVGLVAVPGAPQQMIVVTAHGVNTGADSSVWMIPDTTAATAVKKELLKIDALCPVPFVRGRGIYSGVCHPNYTMANNGFIYLYLTYQGKPDGFPLPVAQIPNLDAEAGFPTAITCTLRISRFTITQAQLNTLLTSSDAPTLASTKAAILGTELRYLNLAEQNLYHSINDCHFGPDGYFYVSFGDEGDQGEPYHNAQKIVRDQFSSMLRIDVDRDFVAHPANLEPNPHYAIIVNPGTGKANFSIPADNPFVGNSVTYDGTTYTPAHPDFAKIRTEMWATGLRNPFKFDIDPVTNDVWVGDVGQDLWEEVTVLNKGDDAGWSYWEGSHLSPVNHPPPNTTPAPTVHKLPEYDYAHSTGNTCVIGGVYYRGTNYSSLQNKYVFGDHTSGHLWSLTRGASPMTATVADLGVGTVSQVVDFHVDPVTNDILMAQYQVNKRIYRLKEVAPTLSTFPTLLSQTGAFADLQSLTPNPGVVPYTPNLKFWSDGADKSRWFAMKNTTDQMAYSRDGLWTFPEGTIFVKHFDMELNHDFPGTNRKRLETRFLVRNASGTYGVSYRWNDAQTDATLVGVSGVDFDIAVQTGGTLNGGVVTDGVTNVQSWHIPSRGECITCHNPNAGHALSLNMRQLNRPGTLSGTSGNFLTLLSQSGYLAGFTDNPATLERYYRADETSVNLDDRVRSFFGVNCSHCHRPNSGIVETWDARGHLNLEQMRVFYNQPLSETYHDANDRIIIPGDKENSLIYNRLQARNVIGDGTHNGYSQMPPIATNVPDQADIQMLAQWIDNYANVAPAITAGTPTQSSVTENALPGSVVATVAATDPDVRAGQADSAALTYSIIGGNTSGLFTLDPVTGQLVVNGILDYETAPQYVLTIAAQDHFVPNPRTTTTTLTVNLQDVANEDANGNGLPDWWEALYAPATLNAGGDFDHNGVRDFFAFMTAQDPTHGGGGNVVSATRVTSPVAGFQLQWRCRNGMYLGMDYLAETSTSLGTWTPLLPAQYQVVSIISDGVGVSKITILVPTAAPNLFFRLSTMH